jgi:hypothetical protein
MAVAFTHAWILMALGLVAACTTVPDLVSVDVGSHAQGFLLRWMADKQPKTLRNVDRLTPCCVLTLHDGDTLKKWSIK